MQSSLIFGEESKFAIRYRECPTEYSYVDNSKMAILHMVLNNAIVSNNLIWYRHLLALDETMNTFITCYYVKDNIITIIVENRWPEESKLNSSNILISKVDLDYFLRTLEEVTDFLKSRYSNL
jgi:hypothetical protein